MIETKHLVYKIQASNQLNFILVKIDDCIGYSH